MTEVQTRTTSTKRTVGLVIAGAVLIGGVVFGAMQLSGGDEPATPSGGTNQTGEGDDVEFMSPALPRPMGGQEAIDALGDRIELVAKINNMSVEKLKSLLLEDSTVQISPNGHIGYGDPAPK